MNGSRGAFLEQFGEPGDFLGLDWGWDCFFITGFHSFFLSLQHQSYHNKCFCSLWIPIPDSLQAHKIHQLHPIQVSIAALHTSCSSSTLLRSPPSLRAKRFPLLMPCRPPNLKILHWTSLSSSPKELTMNFSTASSTSRPFAMI